MMYNSVIGHSWISWTMSWTVELWYIVHCCGCALPFRCEEFWCESCNQFQGICTVWAASCGISQACETRITSSVKLVGEMPCHICFEDVWSLCKCQIFCMWLCSLRVELIPGTKVRHIFNFHCGASFLLPTFRFQMSVREFQSLVLLRYHAYLRSLPWYQICELEIIGENKYEEMRPISLLQHYQHKQGK